MKIRKYREEDSFEIGKLILRTYRDFNLSFANPKQQKELLGPFYHADSHEREHKEKITEVIQAEILLVAEDNGKVFGVLRGKKDKLQSLFVAEEYHRSGIGKKLVAEFESEVSKSGGEVIKLMATIYAVPFYLAVDYKKTTGVRSMKTFDGSGLPYQPMKKILSFP